VLSTANEVGGKNDVLGFFYIGAAGFCFIIIIAGVVYNAIKKPGSEVDLEHMVWN
jgi:hypothetical protein